MNVLMIGMGMVARTHLLTLRDNIAGARLMGVLGRDTDASRAFAAAATDTLGYPVASYDTRADAYAAGPDMALVLTPPDARTAYADELARHGVPTLMEKPVERTLEGAQRVVETYARAEVPLGLCFQHRTRAAARHLKDLLLADRLGTVVHVDIRVPWWRDQAYYDAPGRGTYARDGGGVLINQAIHTLDLAIWLAGPVARVQAALRTSPLHQMEAEDIASALLTFGSGASGVLAATTTAYPGDVENITLTTTTAQVSLRGDTLQIAWHTGRSETVAPDSAGGTGGGADPMAFTHDWHQAVLEDFVAAVKDGRPPLAPPDEALHVHAVIHAMEQAARIGSTVEVTI